MEVTNIVAFFFMLLIAGILLEACTF